MQKKILFCFFLLISLLFTLSCVSKPQISGETDNGKDEEISASDGENHTSDGDKNASDSETDFELQTASDSETQNSSSDSGAFQNENDFYKTERPDNPVISESPVKFKKIKTSYGAESKCRSINQKELSEDLDMFSYLVETCYAGYEKAKEKGLDLKKISKNVRKRFLGKNSVSPDELVTVLAKESWAYINDMHFQLFTENKYFWYCPHQDLYFTNSYVKQAGDEYEIFLTDDSRLKIGEKYTGSEENLFYYPARGLDVFRIGVLSNLKTDYLSVSVENKIFNLKTFDFSSENVRDGYFYEEKDYGDSFYVNISSFNMPEEDSAARKNAEEIFEKYSDAALKCRNKKNVILDLRGNSGGNMNISLLFPIRLYSGLEESFFDKKDFTRDDIVELYMDLIYRNCFTVDSPGTVQNALEYVEKYFPESENDLSFLKSRLEVQKARPSKTLYAMTEYARSDKKTDYRIPKKSAFTGRIFILIDRFSASASEDIISFTKSLFNEQAEIFVVGENSRGCIDFGGILLYSLPNSGINLVLSQSAFYPFENTIETWKGEGKGHFPDYWSTVEDMEETLRRLF